MVLGRDDAVDRSGELGHGVGIERLQRRHMQHADVDAAPRERVGRVERALGHQSGRDDADVLAVAKPRRLADGEAIGGRIEHDRHLAAQEPHIDRAVMVGHRGGRLRDLGRVARVDHDEAGDHAHQGEVLDRLVGAAIAGGEPGQAGDDLHVDPAVRAPRWR